MARDFTEREMTRVQRRLVDDCFEEGQYEIGISALDGLRSPGWKPSPHHIRQLVYLALYPPPEPTEQTAQAETLAAPTKLGLKSEKQVLIPTPEASIAAQDLLLKFAATNYPETLFLGMPKYPMPDSSSTQNMFEEDQESFISTHSRCIRNAKNCWEILREGFVPRLQDTVFAPKRKGRAKKQPVSEDRASPSSPIESRAAVCDHAWPVLQWLLAVFEREEGLLENPTEPPYSSLLLCQIPPPRTGSGGRWDVESILDVICYSAQQDQERYKLYGSRLLTLLVNLMNSTHIDLTMFSNVINNRLLGLQFEDRASLLQGLPFTTPAMHFKLSFYRAFLSETLAIASSTQRPRPQPRVAPKPRSTAASGASTGASTPTLTSGVSSGSSTPKTRKLPTPSSTEVLRLLLAPPSPNDAHSSESVTRIMEVKFQVVQTYVTLQPHGWEPWFTNGQLTQAVLGAFTVNGQEEVGATAGRYLRVLQARLAILKPNPS